MSNSSEIKQYISKWIADNREEFKELCLNIHENPEISLCEYYASGELKKILERHGFQVEMGVSGIPTAFVATYGNGNTVAGFNLEYDALPAMSQMSGETKRIPKESNAPGHACGHNTICTAGSLGAIALRYAVEEYKLDVKIRVFGTAAEEICIGKPYMAKDGYFDDVDFFVDYHPMSYNGVFEDYCCAFFNVRYHFKGKSCHGNKPWYGRSALDGAILTTHAIEMLREHIAPNCDEAANTINYTFLNQPVQPAANVIPENATLWVIGRFRTLKQMQDAMKRIDDAAEGCAKATGTTVEKEFISATHDKIPNTALSKVMYDNLCFLGPVKLTDEEKQRVYDMETAEGYEHVGVSETIEKFELKGTLLCDTSEFSWFAPYATVWLAMAPEAAGWHNWMVVSNGGTDLGYRVSERAAEIMSYTAVDAIVDPELLKKAKNELETRLDGDTYETLIPADAKIPFPEK